MSVSLRILHINSERSWRGGEQQTISLMQGLRRAGHDNFLIAPPGSPILQKAANDGFPNYPVSLRNEWDILSAYRIARIGQKTQPDLIHAETARAHSLALWAKTIHRSQVPIVVSRRVDFPIHANRLGKWKYSQVDLFLPISRAIQHRLLEIGVSREKIRIIPEGVDSQRWTDSSAESVRKEFGITSDSLVIGNVGVCEKNKDQATFLEALAEIIPHHPHVHGFIVGEGNQRISLMNRTRELGIDTHIHFPGFRRDLGNFYRLFDIFVVTSFHEGLCSSILEAQWFGLPVVATRTGGIPDIVQDGVNGLLVPVGSAADTAQAIQRLIDSPALRMELGQSGKQIILDRYTMDRITEQTLEAYDSVLRK